MNVTVEIELYLSNYVTKADLKEGKNFNTSNFPAKPDLASSKAQVDYIDR